MSKLSTHQIAATLETLRAGIGRDRSPRAAAKRQQTIACYEEELKNRIAAGEPDPGRPVAIHQPAAAAPPPIPAADVDPAAIEAAAAIAQRYGTTALVRACVAVLNSRTNYADSMDAGEMRRVIAIGRRVSA
jgi:hypothetical protein